MKAFILISLLTLTSVAFAEDLPAAQTAAEAHTEKAKETHTKQVDREPAHATKQHVNDYAVSGGSR